MTDPILDVAVIGAGHAGVSISYHLKQHSINHIVFERGRIGESWRQQRWDSFVMNTANHKNILPGSVYGGDDPEGFCSASDFVYSLEEYRSKFQLPVLENTKVTSVEKKDGQQYFSISVSENGTVKNYQAKQLIVASGNQNGKRIPAFAEKISPDILQLHTGEYRNAAQLPAGAVLVTGKAHSGCQISHDLSEAG